MRVNVVDALLIHRILGLLTMMLEDHENGLARIEFPTSGHGHTRCYASRNIFRATTSSSSLLPSLPHADYSIPRTLYWITLYPAQAPGFLPSSQIRSVRPFLEALRND